MNKSTPTITDIRGRGLPNPKHFGLKWKEAEKLLDEHRRLREQGREAGREQQAVQAEIRDLEDEHRRQRAAALRAGEEELDNGAIEAAKEKEKELAGHVQDLRRAADMVDADLYRAVAEHREDWLPQVEAKRDKAAARREDILKQLQAVDDELGDYGGLAEWLQKPERAFSRRSPGEPTIAGGGFVERA